MPGTPRQSLELFISYSHRDEQFRAELVKHLKPIEYLGIITTWHDRRIGAGDDWRSRIDQHLESAHIILLLISSDFLASEYCYSNEMRRALERHGTAQARVIPVIIRSVNWHDSPFATLQALPTDAKPVTHWADRDEAFQNIAQGIKEAALQLLQHNEPVPAIRLIDCEVPTPIGPPGDELQIDYILHNSSTVPITVWLGASLIKDGKEFYNKEQDKLIRIEPGRHTATRFLTIGKIPIPDRNNDVADLIATVWYGPKSNPHESLRLATSNKIPIIILSEN
jgi:TIR domain